MKCYLRTTAKGLEASGILGELIDREVTSLEYYSDGRLKTVRYRTEREDELGVYFLDRAGYNTVLVYKADE